MSLDHRALREHFAGEHVVDGLRARTEEAAVVEAGREM
jgi:hypothetical protein